MSSSEKTLLKSLQKGNKEALTALYNLYWEPLFLSAYNLLKKREVCEDIIQEVFINIWKNREKIQIKTSLKSYLYVSVRYQVYSHFRKNKDNLHIELFENLDRRFQYATPETKLMHNELLQLINEVVKTLPKKCRIVYKMSREKQLSHKEISERLNISTKTVENHITKALKTLKTAMGSAFSLELIVWLHNHLH